MSSSFSSHQPQRLWKKDVKFSVTLLFIFHWLLYYWASQAQHILGTELFFIDWSIVCNCYTFSQIIQYFFFRKGCIVQLGVGPRMFWFVQFSRVVDLASDLLVSKHVCSVNEDFAASGLVSVALLCVSVTLTKHVVIRASFCNFFSFCFTVLWRSLNT